MAAGDHLRVYRGGYWHHGIDCGNYRVIHYTARDGTKAGASIQETTQSLFALDGVVEIVPYAQRGAPDAILARARSRLGENAYNVVLNNCEHFARWCVTGEAESDQVRVATSTVAGAAGTGAATVAGLGVVSAAGAAAGLSGAGIMSGLAATGAVVGGGAVAGLGVLGAAPGVVGTAVMRSVLKDDPNLHEPERDARAAGRTGAAVGAGAGTAAAIGAVAAAGVPGLSAVGITSGLAAVGGVVGGGMAAGVAVTVAAPAVAAAAIGYGIYKLFGGGKK
jgi:hypothetical protein